MIKRVKCFYLVLIVLLFTSCSAPGKVIQSTINPCSILTEQEVNQIIGTSMKANRELTFLGDPTSREECQYTEVSPRNGPYVALNLEIDKDALLARTNFEGERSLAGKTQPVQGLGDDAYFDSRLSVLMVLKDNVILNITVIAGLSGEDYQQEFKLEQKLAPIALTRL